MKTILLKSWLVMVCLLMGVGNAWATDVTFTAGTDQSSTTSITKDGITLTATTFSNASYYQAYSGTPLKVESTVGNITKIEITCTASGTSNYGPSKFSSASVGSYSYSGKVGTWTGNASTVSLSNSAQVRMTSVVVTYTPTGGSTPTNYTVTVANNIANGTVTANPTSAAAGATVSLTATPASGYEFGSWNVTNASTNAAITVTNNQFTMPAANVNVSATFNAIQGGGDGDSELTYGYFVKITSQADIVDGGKYLIVREETSSAFAAGIQPNTDTKYLTVNAIAKGGSYTGNVNQTNSPYVYTLKSSTNDGYFYLINNKNYLTGASSSTNITLNNSVSTQSYSDWKLTVNQQKNVTIQNKAAKSGSGSSATLREIRYNTGNPARFADYASGTGSVVTLYKWIPTATIAITTPEGYATFVCKDAIVMPEGIEGSAATAEGGKLSLAWEYQAGDVVPAGTPILVKGTKGEHTANIATGGTAPEANLLVANLTDAAEDAYILAGDADAKCYVLSYDKSGENLGFYWHTETGDGDFKVPVGKVFLALPGSVKGAPAFRLFDEETAVENLKAADAENEIRYNIQGQRVNASAKGIVIMNGKKYVVK